MNFALFEKFGPLHPVSQLWLESETDIKASIYLAFGGYYRQAIAILRNWLELTLLAVYYSNYKEEYKLWKQGKRKSPQWKEIINELFGNKKSKLKNDCNRLYYQLCKFVHTRGIEEYRLQEGRDNVPRYLENSFNLWFELIKETSQINIRLLNIFFGDKA